MREREKKKNKCHHEREREERTNVIMRERERAQASVSGNAQKTWATHNWLQELELTMQQPKVLPTTLKEKRSRTFDRQHWWLKDCEKLSCNSVLSGMLALETQQQIVQPNITQPNITIQSDLSICVWKGCPLRICKGVKKSLPPVADRPKACHGLAQVKNWPALWLTCEWQIAHTHNNNT